MTRFIMMSGLLALAGCASPGTECLLKAEQPMIVTELFFGRDIAGRQPLTDQEWSDFSARVITKEFPDGFTTMNGEGQWRDPASHAPTHERTKILLVATAPTDELSTRITRVRDAYSSLYRQTSVGIVSYNACGSF
jgi:hypothetical protein